MEKERVEWLKKNIGGYIEDVRFDRKTSKPIVFIIDNQRSEGNSIQEALEKENFVVFSPRNLSEVAIQNIQQNWPEHSRQTYNSSKLSSRLMIVDPTQEEKNELLAEYIINFYNETATNYKLFNCPTSNGEMIPAFEGIGDLGNILVSVGFTVQKSDDGNKITVYGEGFSLTVDGISGKITNNPIVTEESLKNISCKNRGSRLKFLKKIFGFGNIQR